MFQIPLVLAVHGFESMECVDHLDCPLPGQSCVYGQCRVVREFAGDDAPDSAPESDQCHPECPDNYNCINGKCVRYVEEPRGRVKKSWPECFAYLDCPLLNLCVVGFCVGP
ncbi:hypothetical protein GCK72_004236 [Caenorhabditis remanei]|uniref:EB domain-containing protein n=1 Tax=Caenorhabditis remanei TaxID=31234 RepID=A0A6A5HB61_CAERE|nr:hypothetical protein GCK72_004236 [Caenorhabditis remanei]KAF1764289.1 hypothetical protein GCK72_004236 [Caenorhabditis remanei]